LLFKSITSPEAVTYGPEFPAPGRNGRDRCGLPADIREDFGSALYWGVELDP
jgi:hypothetical protein